jgi:hypothetical protein
MIEFLPVFTIENVEGPGHGLIIVKVGVEKIKNLKQL